MKYIWPIILLLSYASIGQEIRLLESDFVMGNERLSNPYFGGFDNPQFSNIDLNQDGVEDLIVFDRQGAIVTPYLRLSNEWVYSPEYRSSFPQDLRFWMIVRDFDGDGIGDLFTSKYISGSGIRVFKGSYDSGSLSFQLQTFYDGVNDRVFNEVYYRNFSGSFLNLVIPTADFPAFEDVDADGDLDILAIQESGNKIYFYRNTSVELGFGRDSLLFQLEERCWGGIVEADLGSDIFLSDEPGKCADEFFRNEEKEVLHAESAISVFDTDGDGDMDLFVGDTDYDRVSFFRNEKTDGFDWMNEFSIDFPREEESIQMDAFLLVQFVNIDRDQENEMLVTPNQFLNAKNQLPILSYDNTGVGKNPFELKSNNWLPNLSFDFGSESHPVFVDVNQDGLQDLLIGNYGVYDEENSNLFTSLYLFLNTGSIERPEFTLANSDWLGLSRYSNQYIILKPAFGDLDDDDDLDLIVGTNTGHLIYYENVAGPNNPMNFAAEKLEYFDIQVSTGASPQIVDLDQDGLSDLVIGDALGFLSYFKNIGQSGQPDFIDNPETSPNVIGLGGIRVVPQNISFLGRATPFILEEEGQLVCYTGDVTGGFQKFIDLAPSTEPWTKVASPLDNVFEGRHSTIAISNINHKEGLEFAVGNHRGGLAIYTSDQIMSNTPIITKVFPFKIYPNPTHGILYYENNRMTDGILQIFDVNGQNALTFELNSIDGILNLNNQPSGVYLYQLYNRKGIQSSGKIILH
jgi:hypothetical protein